MTDTTVVFLPFLQYTLKLTQGSVVLAFLTTYLIYFKLFTPKIYFFTIGLSMIPRHGIVYGGRILFKVERRTIITTIGWINLLLLRPAKGRVLNQWALTVLKVKRSLMNIAKITIEPSLCLSGYILHHNVLKKLNKTKILQWKSLIILSVQES